MRLTLRRHYSSTLLLNWAASLGAALGAVLGLQIATGLALACRISIDSSFISLASTLRANDVAFLVRGLHAAGATILMALTYAHMFKGAYESSSSTVRLVWSTGIILYILAIGICFTGYSLTGGQMSHWAITVITSLVSAVPVLGQIILETVWGGTVVSQVTVNRLWVAHFTLPALMAGLALAHIALLHKTNSTRYLASLPADRINFTPMYVARDAGLAVVVFILVGALVLNSHLVVDVENSVPSNPSVTPPSIAPEWYLLPYYGLVRAIPSKIVGVVAMGLAYTCILSLGDAGIRFATRAPQTVTLTRVALTLLVVDMVCVSSVCLKVNHAEALYGLLVASVLAWMAGSITYSPTDSLPVSRTSTSRSH